MCVVVVVVVERKLGTRNRHLLSSRQAPVSTSTVGFQHIAPGIALQPDT